MKYTLMSLKPRSKSKETRTVEVDIYNPTYGQVPEGVQARRILAVGRPVYARRTGNWKGQAYLVAEVEPVHIHGCPATRTCSRKGPTRCTCGAWELFETWLEKGKQP